MLCIGWWRLTVTLIVSDFRLLSVILVSSVPLMEKGVPPGKKEGKREGEMENSVHCNEDQKGKIY